MIRERTSAGPAAARAEGRVGGRRKKLDAAKRREIAESVITGRKSGADMAGSTTSASRPCRASSPRHRMAQPQVRRIQPGNRRNRPMPVSKKPPRKATPTSPRLKTAVAGAGVCLTAGQWRAIWRRLPAKPR